jgi:hypothetical protein
MIFLSASKAVQKVWAAFFLFSLKITLPQVRERYTKTSLFTRSPSLLKPKPNKKTKPCP